MSIAPWIDQNCYDFLEEETFSDVTLSIGKSKFKAHKVILANASKFFDRKFIVEEDCAYVDLEYLDVHPSLFSVVMYFLYTGGHEKPSDENDSDPSETKVPSMIHNGNILPLWKCSKELQIDTLTQHCSNFFSQYARFVDSSCAHQVSNWLSKCSLMNLEEVEYVILTIVGSTFSRLVNLDEIGSEVEDLTLLTGLSSAQFIKFLNLEVLDLPNEFFVFQLVLKYLDCHLLQNSSSDLDEFDEIVDRLYGQPQNTNTVISEETVEQIWNLVHFELLEDSQLIELQENFSKFEKYKLPSRLIINALIFKLQQRASSFPTKLGHNFSGVKNTFGYLDHYNNEYYVWYLGNVDNMESGMEYTPRRNGRRSVLYDLSNSAWNVKCYKAINSPSLTVKMESLQDKPSNQSIYVKIEGLSQVIMKAMTPNQNKKEVSFDLGSSEAKKHIVLNFYLVTEGQVLSPVVTEERYTVPIPEEEEDPIKPVIRPNYSSFFNSSYFSDIQLECEGNVISAHRIILCCGSNYFQSMFASGWNENQKSKILSFAEIKYEVLYDMIRFLYCGSVKLTDSNVIPMWIASQYYQVDPLQEECDKYLARITDEKLLDFITEASQLHATALEDVFLHRLRISYKVLSQSDIQSWKSLSCAQIIEIISNDTIGCTNEHQLYEFCVRFLEMKQATETVTEEIKTKFLECIRFPFFTHLQLLQALKSEDPLPKELKQNKILSALSHKLARVESVEVPLVNYGESQCRARSLYGTTLATISVSPNQSVLETQEEFSDRLGNRWQLSLKLDTEAGFLSTHIQCIETDEWKISLLNDPIPKACECTLRLINHKDETKSPTKTFTFDYQKVVTSQKRIGYQIFYRVPDLSALHEEGLTFDSKLMVEVSFQFHLTTASKFVVLALEHEDSQYEIEAELVEKEPDSLLEWLLMKQFMADGTGLIVQLKQPESVIQLNISKLTSPLDMLFINKDDRIVNIFKSVYWANLKSTKPASCVVILQPQTVDKLQLTCDFQATIQ